MAEKWAGPVVPGGAPGHGDHGSLHVCEAVDMGAIEAGACGERTLSLRNAGTCPLDVTGVRFKHPSRHWKLVDNPFPARLAPGCCLDVGVRYKATEECPRRQALVVESDDPEAPVREIDLSAYTVWNDDRP